MSLAIVDTVVSEVVSKQLQGELLTIVDAVSGDRIQRDAIKSLVRQSCQKCVATLGVRLDAIVTKPTDKKVDQPG